MIETLRQFADEHQTLLTWLAWGSGAMLVVSLLTLPAVAVMLPRDFIVRTLARDEHPRSDSWWNRHSAVRVTLRVLKNVVGVLLAIAGLAMLVLPGQGLITLALSLVLLDLPGKRKLEARVLRSPKLLGPINRLRHRFGKPPLDEPEDDRPADEPAA